MTNVFFALAMRLALKFSWFRSTEIERATARSGPLHPLGDSFATFAPLSHEHGHGLSYRNECSNFWGGFSQGAPAPKQPYYHIQKKGQERKRLHNLNGAHRNTGRR